MDWHNFHTETICAVELMPNAEQYYDNHNWPQKKKKNTMDKQWNGGLFLCKSTLSPRWSLNCLAHAWRKFKTINLICFFLISFCFQDIVLSILIQHWRLHSRKYHFLKFSHTLRCAFCAVSKEEFVLVLFIHFLCARNFIFIRYFYFFFLHLAIFGNSILKRQLQSGQCALSDKFILSWMRFMLIQSIWQTLFNLESSAIVFAHWVQMHFFVLFSFNNFSLPTTSLSFNLSSNHK